MRENSIDKLTVTIALLAIVLSGYSIYKSYYTYQEVEYMTKLIKDETIRMECKFINIHDKEFFMDCPNVGSLISFHNAKKWDKSNLALLDEKVFVSLYKNMRCVNIVSDMKMTVAFKIKNQEDCIKY